jgi:hypothetical protein
MTSSRQGDLFGHDGSDPSDEDFETPTWYPDPDEVRAELHAILAQMRALRNRRLGTMTARRSTAPSFRG